MGKKTKIFLLSAFLVYVGALAADIVYSLRYRTKVNDGSAMFLCEAFRLSDDLMNGYNSTDGAHIFLGVDKVDEAVDDLTGLVASDSPVLQSVSTIVDQTESIAFALDEFVLYLNHISDLLGDAQNNDIGQYECVFCKTCCSGSDSLVDGVTASISSTVASALNTVRRQVRQALTGDGISAIRSALNESRSAVTSMQSGVDDTVESVFISNTALFESILKYVDIGTIVIIASMALPTLLVLIVVFLGVFRSSQRSYFDPALKPRNPCCASCSWCVTFLHAFLLFLIAGLLGIASYVLASGCEIIQDPHTMVHSTFSRFIGDDSRQLLNIVDTCAVQSGSGDLLSTVTVGTNETLRSQLNVTDEIDAKFDYLDNLTSQSANRLFSENAELISLFDAMDSFGSLFTMSRAAVESLLTDPSLAPSVGLIMSAGSSASVQSLLEQAVTGIPDCGGRSNVDLGAADSPVGSKIREALNFPSSTQFVSFQGLNDFAGAINAATIDIGASGTVCPTDYLTLNPPDITLASPFHMLVSWRTNVLQNTFRCDQIQVTPDPVTGMAVSLIQPRSCTWTQWLNFVSSLRADLISKAQNVDIIQQATISSIQTDLRDLVQTAIFPKMNTLLNGCNCKFVAERYQGLYRSLCWWQAPGLIGSVITWLVFGGLCWIAILIEFVIWRHWKDNISIWRDNVMERGDKQGNVVLSQEGTLLGAQASIGYPVQHI
jgi:hypothetical protein